MERRYPPLQPQTRSVDNDLTSPASEVPDASSTPHFQHELLEHPELKRRRIGVSIACNECRRRKIRCDGRRPTCSNCEGKIGQCEYRDEIAISQESRKFLTEVIRILNRLPPINAIRVLDELSEADASTILTTLRNRADAHFRPEEADELATPSPGANIDNSLISAELELHNPVAYPDLSKSEPNLMGEKSYRELTQSLKSESATPQTRSTGRPTPKVQQSSKSQPSTPLASELPGALEQRQRHKLCDSRLANCRIARWTGVEINDDLAARCISLYLETDHPLLGHFDPDLFLSELVSDEGKEHQYCSPLLVNSLLYWACQMYSAIDSNVDRMALLFCQEAENLWEEERRLNRDSILNMAAAEFLSLGYLGQGRDHMVLKYLSEATEMGKRMGLFGVKNETPPTTTMMDEAANDNDEGKGKSHDDDDDDNRKLVRARMYAAWGVFNFATLMSFFYRQPGMSSILAGPPSLPIPKPSASTWSLPYMGQTFPHLCRFWTIIREVSALYRAEGNLPWAADTTLVFAEFKFRELLAWSNSLPFRLSSDHGNRPHHVEVMHLWFHAAILDIFRPFTYDAGQCDLPLRTFSSGTITPNVIFKSSTTRLKRLILSFRLHYTSSTYTILWHTALLYATNAILEATEPEQEDRYPYLLVFLYGYVRLSSAWRVAKAVSKGLLSMIMRQGHMSSDTARRILRDLDGGHVRDDDITGTIRATFMLDLQNASTEPDSSTVEKLADDFEGNAMMMEYTNLLNNDNLE